MTRYLGTQDEIRAALALALDGVASCDHQCAFDGYVVARACLRGRQARTLDVLAQAPDGAIRVVATALDGAEHVLRAAGVRFTRCDQWDAGCSAAAIVFVGCPGPSLCLDPRVVRRFLAHGGVLVTSDRAASLTALDGLLPLAGRGAPRRARVALVGETPAGGLLPVVGLSAGHDRLAAPRDGSAARVLAIDVLSGDPLAIVAPVGAGMLVHAVPHWFQEALPALTELERRPVATAREYAGRLDMRTGDMTVGQLQVAETMLGILMTGLDAALGVNGLGATALGAQDAA